MPYMDAMGYGIYDICSLFYIHRLDVGPSSKIDRSVHEEIDQRIEGMKFSSCSVSLLIW